MGRTLGAFGLRRAVRQRDWLRAVGRPSLWESTNEPVAASGLARLNFLWESIILKVERRAGWAIALSPGFLGTGRKVRTPQGSVLANGQDLPGLS